MYKQRPLFITFEGIEGSGKSYQSIGSIGDDFIIVRIYKPTVQGNRIVSPNNYLNFVGHISYKDNPHKKMSVAIIQGSLVNL